LAGRDAHGLAFEVAQDQRCAVFLWQARHFLIDSVTEFAAEDFRKEIGRGHRFHLLLFSLATRRISPGFNSEPVGDSVQPAGERSWLADHRRPPGQHQESGLENVFGILLMAHDAPADTKHHGTVPPHQAGKTAFVMAFEELP
jgi:hypothetical protein